MIKISVDQSCDMIKIKDDTDNIFIGNYWDISVETLISIIHKVREDVEVDYNWEFE